MGMLWWSVSREITRENREQNKHFVEFWSKFRNSRNTVQRLPSLWQRACDSSLIRLTFVIRISKASQIASLEFTVQTLASIGKSMFQSFSFFIMFYPHSHTQTLQNKTNCCGNDCVLFRKMSVNNDPVSSKEIKVIPFMKQHYYCTCSYENSHWGAWIRVLTARFHSSTCNLFYFLLKQI